MDQVEDVKDKIDIVETIGSYLTLKKAGTNYKGLCPFHNEKTPSFMVSPERQTFKCFGCGKGGDVFTFVEEIEGLDFYDALKMLAGRVGIEIKSSNFKSADDKMAPTEKSRVLEINELAAKFYHKILLDHPKAEEARKYLLKRGLTAETIKEFQIGYAPNSWDLIIRALKTKGFSEPELFKAGLLVLSDKGKYWDRFRGRITFPISNISGQIVAFTARLLVNDDPKAAKYVNSSESPVYHKGKVIYGLDRARFAIRTEDKAVMVEGNMDVIACHQAGFKNVVAVSGTALTAEQLRIIARYSSNIYFSFDNDNAGQTAMKRAIILALENDLNARVIKLRGFKDPDEAIKADPKNWQVAIKGAKPALENWIDELVLEVSGLGVAEKKQIAKEILPVIKIIQNDLEREHYVKYLAKKIASSESSLLELLKKTKTKSSEFRQKIEEVTEQKNLTALERLAGIVYAHPELGKELPDFIYKFKIENPTVRDYLSAIKSGMEKSLSNESKQALDLLAMGATSEFEGEDSELFKKEFESLISSLKNLRRDKIKQSYADEIAKAESAGDREKIKELIAEFQSAIIKETNNFSTNNE